MNKNRSSMGRRTASPTFKTAALAAAALWGCHTVSAADPELIGKAMATGDEVRVDSWVDAWLLAQKGPAGQAVSGPYAANHDILDTSAPKRGQFAIRYVVEKPAKEQAFGFFSGPYLTHWALAKAFTLRGWIKAEAAAEPESWTMALYDRDGHRAAAPLDLKADGVWREFTLPLAKLEADAEFDFGAVRSVQVEAALAKGDTLWLDDVRFERDGEVLGVSDKTVTQFMAEAEATHPVRVAQTLSNPRAGHQFEYIAALYKGENLEEANRMVLDWVKQADGDANGAWSLWPNTTANWLLCGFGSKGRIAPGRLTPEAEKAVLDWYWHHCEIKNDIATARHSTWWVTGSENHDINFKMANLISSQIFMNEPAYADRIYPDYGRMQGYMYGDGSVFRAGAVSPTVKMGSGNYKDGKDYNAADHYKAWVPFWKEFMAERARHGFFIEHNASGYMLHTGRFLHDIYAWCDDAGLRQQARMFIDLAWAQWAQDQTLGFCGGPCTRGEPGWTRMGRMAEFLLGGPAGLGHIYAFSDYQWPRAVWEMVLGRGAMGEYAFVSRKPNEAQDVWPQPPGTEYTMIVNPESRLVRYSWVTPDYVMGARMDHPDALYHHLSGGSEGITFSTTPDASIHWLKNGWNLAVQDHSVALMMKRKTGRFQSPAWFPLQNVSVEQPRVVTFGKGLDRIVERDGWVFVEEGNAFVAIRVVDAAADTIEPTKKKGRNLPTPVAFDENGCGLYKLEPNPHTWVEGEAKPGANLEPRNPFSPLIVEASRRPLHATLEAFMEDVLDNPIRLRQVIGSGFILSYRGCGPDAKELELNFSSQKTPRIDGEYIRYDCPTFDSPWLKGATGGGVVTLNGPLSGKRLILDFNKAERRELAGP